MWANEEDNSSRWLFWWGSAKKTWRRLVSNFEKCCGNVVSVLMHGQFVDVYWQLVCVLINLLISKNWRSWWSLNVTIGQRSFRRGLQKTGKSKVINLHLFLIPESGLLSVGYVGFPAKHVSGFTTKWMYTVKVVFSDDSINQFKHQQVQYQQVQYVHRRSGVSLQEDCVIQHVKITCRSWCGVSWYWPFAHRSRPYEVQNNIEKASDSSAEWLGQQARLFWHWRPHFHAQRRPCNKCRSVMAFLEAYGIETPPRPDNSPDMNPIENLWSLWTPKCTRKPSQTSNTMISGTNFGVGAWLSCMQCL